MTTIILKFRNAEEMDKTDLTRIGILSGATSDGLTWEVEPQIESWDEVDFEVFKETLRSGLSAAGVFVEIEAGS